MKEIDIELILEQRLPPDDELSYYKKIHNELNKAEHQLKEIKA